MARYGKFFVWMRNKCIWLYRFVRISNPFTENDESGQIFIRTHWNIEEFFKSFFLKNWMNIGIFFIEKRKDRECSKRNLFFTILILY